MTNRHRTRDEAKASLLHTFKWLAASVNEFRLTTCCTGTDTTLELHGRGLRQERRHL